MDKREKTIINEDESLDYILGGLELIQPLKGYRFSLDSVLLAHFPGLEGTNTIVDLGTGSGIIPLLLSLRAPSARIIGIEVQDSMVKRARRTVKHNKLENRIEILQEDIKYIRNKLPGNFAELVISNPPFWKEGEGKICENKEEAIARHELLIDMGQITAAAHHILSSGGRFCIIQRADRLPEIMKILEKNKLVPKKLRTVHSFINQEAQKILIEAQKNGHGGFTVFPPLIIYDRAGEYSEEIKNFYKENLPIK